MTPHSREVLEHRLKELERSHESIKSDIEYRMNELHDMLDQRHALIDRIENLKEDLSQS